MDISVSDEAIESGETQKKDLRIMNALWNVKYVFQAQLTAHGREIPDTWLFI